MEEIEDTTMKQILVVDNSTVIRKVARRILEGMNFQTVEAEDGRKALRRLQLFYAGCNFADWNMPVMDGLEFRHELRKMPARHEAESRLLHIRKMTSHISLARSMPGPTNTS